MYSVVTVANNTMLQNRRGRAERYRRPPFFLRGLLPILGLLCPPPEEKRLSMPEIGEKERNYYLFKSYTD